MFGEDADLRSGQKEQLGSQGLSDAALGRAGIYALLADCLNQTPDAARLTALLDSLPLLAAATSESASTAIAALQSTLDEAMSKGHGGELPDEFVTEIGVERTRMLRGVKPGYGLPPATDSVYGAVGEPAWAAFQPQRASALLGEYRSTGFTPEASLPPDYLGNELAYLAFLSETESAAWAGGDHDQALSVVARQVHFIDEHPLRWLDRLLHRVLENTSNPFWPAFLSVLIAWLRSDQAYLLELLEEDNPGTE